MKSIDVKNLDLVAILRHHQQPQSHAYNHKKCITSILLQEDHSSQWLLQGPFRVPKNIKWFGISLVLGNNRIRCWNIFPENAPWGQKGRRSSCRNSRGPTNLFCKSPTKYRLSPNLLYKYSNYNESNWHSPPKHPPAKQSPSWCPLPGQLRTSGQLRLEIP